MNGMICLVNCTELHYVMGIQSFISCQIVRDVVFLLCMKNVDNGCMFMCTHVFTVFTNISMILFFKRKNYFAFKGIKFA